MKNFVNEEASAQGELLFRKIDSLPEGLTKLLPEGGSYIVGHSETGHHHAIMPQEGVEVYANDNDPFSLYLVVDNPINEVELEHQRSYDKHASHYFKNGVYYIRRQWEDNGEDLVPVLDQKIMQPRCGGAALKRFEL